jgi:hypothetical protein
MRDIFDLCMGCSIARRQSAGFGCEVVYGVLSIGRVWYFTPAGVHKVDGCLAFCGSFWQVLIGITTGLPFLISETFSGG